MITPKDILDSSKELYLQLRKLFHDGDDFRLLLNHYQSRLRSVSGGRGGEEKGVLGGYVNTPMLIEDTPAAVQQVKARLDRLYGAGVAAGLVKGVEQLVYVTEILHSVHGSTSTNTTNTTSTTSTTSSSSAAGEIRAGSATPND